MVTKKDMAELVKRNNRLWTSIGNLFGALQTANRHASEISGIVGDVLATKGFYSEEYLDALQELDRECKSLEPSLVSVFEISKELLAMHEDEARVFSPSFWNELRKVGK